MPFSLIRRATPAILGVALLLVMALVALPAAAERVHVVAQGHTLGKIAKRYNVSIDALCKANRLNRRDRLKLGQRIIIPDPRPPSDAKDDAKDEVKDDVKDDVKEEAKEKERPPPRQPSPSKPPRVDAERPYTTHQVSRGHTLGKIARRYRTSVDAIRQANSLPPREPLKVGSCLVIPLTDQSTSQHRSRKLPCLPDSLDVANVDKHRRPDDAYSRTPDEPGVVHLVRGSLSFRGKIFNRQAPIAEAVAKIDAMLFDRRTNHSHTTDARLLQKVVQVSDYFGGRRIIIVSGYREESSNPHTTRSNHALGRAIDFQVEGVPNEVVRNYLHRMSAVGVGFYPNSSFVHLDVRSVTTHWTDVSGPGEAPRYTNIRAPQNPGR